MAFDPQYVSHVLRENFEDAKALFLEPLLAIYTAHLVMLADRRLISGGDARAIAAALSAISVEDVQRMPFDGTCEDLFFQVDRLLADACGAEVAGRLHIARSRNDIDMTMYRMRLREWIAALVDAVLGLRGALVELADRHRGTLMAAHTHTQPAQPTTVAHYLLGIIEQLERDVVRLRAAYATTNRCPLGACAITGTGFPIDRQLTSDLLGFDGPTGNTYGSIAAVDYLLESVSAVAVLLVGLGRVLQDLLLWCTMEVGSLRLPDGFVQQSSIMPQKRNPVALEHARAIASKAAGQAAAVFFTVHNTPFGDIVDTEDDLQPLVAATFKDAMRAVALAGAALARAGLDVARLEARAAEGGTTLTELADQLVRDHGLTFATARTIAARFHEAWQRDPAAPGRLLASIGAEVAGVPLEYSDAQIAEITSPRRFVDVRSTPGGPAPAETGRAIAAAQAALDADRRWLAGARAALASASARLAERSRAL